MCSFSSNAGELWVSLVEKAFLKAMGGYHFPGTMTTPMHYSRSCSNGCFLKAIRCFRIQRRH